MKKIITLFSLTAFLFGAMSCQKANLDSPVKRVPMTFTANSASTVDTKVAVGENGLEILWSENDSVRVYDTTTDTNVFHVISGAGTRNAVLSGEAVEQADFYFAVYPYQDWTVQYMTNVNDLQVKSAQMATQDTFDPEAALFFAKSKGTNNFDFLNVCAFIKVIPSNDLVSVEITPNGADAYLAGSLSVYMSTFPEYAFMSGKKIKSAKISASKINKNKPYYIAVVPQTLTGGFKVTVENYGGGTKIYNTNTNVTLTRGYVYPLQLGSVN